MTEHIFNMLYGEETNKQRTLSNINLENSQKLPRIKLLKRRLQI